MDETKKKILEMLEKLAGTVGEVGGHLWAAACRATMARGISGVVGGVLTIILVLILWRVLNINIAKDWTGEDKTVMSVVTTVVAAIASVIAIVCMVSHLPDVIAPEGQTILYLLGK